MLNIPLSFVHAGTVPLATQAATRAARCLSQREWFLLDKAGPSRSRYPTTR